MRASEGRDYLLYLPLYNGVSSVEIGLPKSAKLMKAPAYPAHKKPIVFYGTSITHGASASRPGMVHTAKNAGKIAVVIYLSSLFPDGAPASSPAQ